MKNLSIVGAKILLLPFFIMPKSLRELSAYMLALFWFFVLRLRRSLAIKQVKAIYPEKGAGEVSKIAFKSIFNLCLVIFEFAPMMFSNKKVKKETEVRGHNYLDEACKKNKPVFILTGHLGGFEIGQFSIGLKGHKLNLIAKRVKNGFLDKALFYIRERSGLLHIAPKNGAREILKAIKKNEIVVFVHDQYMHPPKGLKTTFLGKETYTNPSCAYFSSKFDTVVLPANIYREKGKVITEFFPEIPWENKTKDSKENLIYMTQKYNNALESFIHERPESWMWVHKRWKNDRKIL